MEVNPQLTVTRFEQLEPGDLFVYPQDSVSCLALKLEKPANGDSSPMVVLGPTFPYEADESFIIDWQRATVISFGKDYSVLLPTDPSAWFSSGNLRKPVCLAVSDDRVFVCTNGGPSPQRFFQCFVELSTGKLVEKSLQAAVAYTNHWELVVSHQHLLQRTIIKYPRKEAAP